MASADAPAVVLVGGGKMGGALLAGWLRGVLDPSAVIVVEPDAATAARLAALGVSCVRTPQELPEAAPATVLLAVKPQVMGGVISGYKAWAGPDTLFVSIAAGCQIALFEGALGPVPIVRAMPNTPAAIGQGITVACPNAAVSATQRAACERLLSAVGGVAWVDDEALMDAVTAVSGSGPAYVFLLAECLAEAGAAAGLPPDLAERLARETVSGAGALLRESAEAPGTLRENVTSPGGTTAAALEILMAGEGLAPLMVHAVAAATERSRALAS